MSAAQQQNVGAAGRTPFSVSGDFVADMLFGIRVSAEAAERFIATEDAAGLDYCARKIVAYTRQLVATVADLKEQSGGARR